MRKHLWQGNWISHQELLEKTMQILPSLKNGYAVHFEIEEFFRSCDRFSRRLLEDEDLRTLLITELTQAKEAHTSDAKIILAEIASFMSESCFRKKVQAEFGTDNPMRSQRVDFNTNIFENWFPLGFVVQILASNSPSLAVLSALEGLVTGNINFIKVSSDSSDFTALFFSEFFKDPVAKDWQSLLMIARFSSKEKEIIFPVIQEADAVVAWGGEEALAQIRLMAPARAKIIEWGHRISFSYITQNNSKDPLVFQKLAQDVFRFDQQACSSPQCLFVEGATFSDLIIFAQKLAAAFKIETAKNILTPPDDLEAGEISRVVEVTKIESSLRAGLTEVIQDENGMWRILIDTRPGLRASPLFRTVWLKSIQREQILTIFRPLGQYLQTVGLSCERKDLYEISKKLYQAGVTRIRESGEMLKSYPGEPHDGYPALIRYMKKVSLEQGAFLDGFATTDDLSQSHLNFIDWPKKTMGKKEFQSQSSEIQNADLYFKSGGSSGESKLSLFTYEDYHRQMRLAADGLMAAGLDSSKDRCMNLFFSGGLYGGFLSFYTILEDLHAVQFPMSAHLDLQFVAETIIKNKVNVLLGMPSYLMQLFKENSELFKKHQVVSKIFYGGEHFTEAQKANFGADYGIQHIYSASYGSVDMGPLGYQCRECQNGIHHLHHHLHHLEILKLDSNLAVEGNEIGRLVFSTHGRHGQKLVRYDLGDLGLWIEGDCPCGRKSPRFKLMGRYGDIFRAAGSFFNYNKFGTILIDHCNYNQEFQILIDKHQGQDRLCLIVADTMSTPTELSQMILKHYADLQEVVELEKSLIFEIQKVRSHELAHIAGSGKLRRVIDERR